VVVDTFSRLNTSVSQTVPHVVERIVFLNIHHPVGHTVPECVWRDVVGIAAPAVDEIQFNAS